MDTALRLFSENGYSAVSMRDLAAALGIQAPSIYSHFESKDALLVAVVGPFVEASSDLLDQFPVAPVSKEDRRAWLTSAITLLATHPLQLQLIAGDRSLAGHPMFGPQLRGMRTTLIECLVRSGAADPEWAVAVIGAIVYSVLPQGGADTDARPVDVPKVARILEAFLDAG